MHAEIYSGAYPENPEGIPPEIFYYNFQRFQQEFTNIELSTIIHTEIPSGVPSCGSECFFFSKDSSASPSPIL